MTTTLVDLPAYGDPGPEQEEPTTTVPVPAPAAFEVRRQTGQLRRSDFLAAVGAALSSVSLTAVLFSQVLPFNGPLGFVVVAYVLFLGLYALLVSFDEDGPAVRDRVVAAVVHSLAVLLLLALGLVIYYTVFRGRTAVFGHGNFLIHDLSSAGPLDPLSKGGILHGVVGTLEQITIALTITIPLGLTCAVFLTEVPGRFSRFVRTIVEAMTALPSIVAGLFIYATVILVLGFGKSGFAAGLAITVMMLPIVIRASDVVLRLVPGTLREASLALGASQWRTAWHVVLPTARSGLATSVILGTARGIGETSPVLLTAGFTAALNLNPLEGNQVSLPLLTFSLVRSASAIDEARGFGAATVLLALVLLLFIFARLIGGRGPGQMSKRAQASRARASQRDVLRFAERFAAAQSQLPESPLPAGPSQEHNQS